MGAEPHTGGSVARMRVFLTGASGFIGKALAARFTATGAEVRGVDLVADPAARVVAGDVSEPGAWQAHAEGSDLVVHTAAVVSLRLRDPGEVWRVNVLGTEHALQAAERAGAARFLHFSSVTVFGTEFPDQVDERHPVRPTGIPYPDTKIASEQVVLQAHLDGRVPVTIVRPGDVYGPGSRAWAVQPVELLKARRFVLPAGGRGIFSPVFVDDLVAGVAAAAAHPDAAGQTFTLSGGVGVPNREFFGHYADALGVRLPSVPAPVARRLAAVADRVDRVDRKGTGDLNPRAVDYLMRTGTYSVAKAQRALGWAPEVGLETGMERTLAWLRAEGLL